MQPSRIHVTGASGSGTTTLGRALAEHWSVPHADADDYLFVPTDPPYVEKRAPASRVSLMRELFAPKKAWVLSGSVMEWGEPIVAECDAVVFLTLDPRERLRRLEAREVRRRAEGDFDHAAWTEFTEWAAGYDDPAFAGRSRHAHDAWLDSLDQPVLSLDSEKSVRELRDAVLAWNPSPRVPR